MNTLGSSKRTRLHRPRLRTFSFGGALLAAVVVPAALASHQFSDVPTASPHHDDISAISSAGITGGCAPGLYCPAEPVRRDQMASFLRRGLGRTTIASGGSVILTSNFQNVVDGGITTGGSGVVLATGDFSPFASAGSLGGAVAVEFRIVRDGGGQSITGVTTLYPATVISTASASRTWYFNVGAPGNEFFHLQARLALAGAGDLNDVSAEAGSLTLLYVPLE